MELERALVADERVVRGRLADHDRARLAHQLRQLGEVARADAAVFLGGREHQHHARGALELVRETARREQDRRHAGLHVGGAATVQAVAVGLARERVARPGAGTERDDVQVPGEAQGRLAAVAARARDYAGAPGLKLVERDLESPAFEQLCGVPGAVGLLARGVDRVVVQQ